MNKVNNWFKQNKKRVVTMRNEKLSTNFPHPWRGIITILIFLFLAPPVYVTVVVFMGHQFVGGRQILFEIGALLREHVFPLLLTGYSFYMPPVFFAALWSAWRPAHGRALRLGAAVSHMVITGLLCEILYQLFVLLAGGFLRLDILMVDFVQWILSAFICWLVAQKLGLAKDVPK